jgi:hypothetical protein
MSDLQEVAPAPDVQKKMTLQDLPVDIIDQLAISAPVEVLKDMRLISRKMNSMVLHEFYRRIPKDHKITLNELSIDKMVKVIEVEPIAERIVEVTFAMDTFGCPSYGKDLSENESRVLQKKDDELRGVYRRELPYLFEIMVELPNLAKVVILKEEKHVQDMRERRFLPGTRTRT